MLRKPEEILAEFPAIARCRAERRNAVIAAIAQAQAEALAEVTNLIHLRQLALLEGRPALQRQFAVDELDFIRSRLGKLLPEGAAR